MRPRNVIIFASLILLLNAPLAMGQMECEVPVFVSVAASPNIMIIADNSGSMNIVIFHSVYDPATTYSGDYNSNSNYYAHASSYRTNALTKNGRTADLFYGPGDDGHGVRYPGNYLNWIYWHADATQRQNLPQQTRMQVSREVISNIVKDTADVRFGIMKFNHSEGGTIVASTGDITSGNIDTYLGSIKAKTWTPLAETLLESWFYFKGADKCYGGSGTYSSPIQYWCQKNFVILVTDGEPYYDYLDKNCASSYCQNWDGDSENEKGDPDPIGYRYLNDIAYYMNHHDARGDLDETQNIVTYTIGFSLAGWGAELLMDTADYGDGEYFTAWNAQELTEALQGAIFDIIRRVSAGAPVALLSTAEEGQDRLIRAKFLPGSWKGYLEAFSLPYSSGDSPLWKAGDLLKDRSASNRTIFTLYNGNKTDFAATNANLKTDLSTLWGVTADEAGNIINYIRGDDTDEGTTYRDRDGWKLGDIAYSAPTIVGPPAYYYTENNYPTFKENNSNREKMVYVGANDGMLHAFKLSDGSELWAYIPSNLWEKLEHLADPEYCHEYFVDLPPKVVDIYDGSNWKTVLIGGERGGGNTYFALDITDPDNPLILWELTDQDLGETWSIPATGKVNIGGSDKWVAFVGSGFENNDTKGYLFVIDINTGAILWSLKLSDDTDNCLTSPTAVDTNENGYIDTVYTGDLKGKIWKFDVSDTNIANWSGSLLFHAVDGGGSGQPITARPVVSFDLNLNPVIYFGTGKFYNDTDKTTTQQQGFYGIIDDGSGTIAKADLVDQTTTIHPLTTDDKGWYINLSVSSPSERVICEATVVAGVVLFTSFIPDDDACAYGGFSYLWAVDYLAGGAPDESVLTDLEEGERRKDLGSGIPSTPVVSIKHEEVIIQTSDATIHTEKVSLPDLGVKLRSWREVF